MKVSDLLVQCLEREGVEYIFGLPGEENEDLLFSLESSSIRFIPCRHEQGAAFIANIWGRLTGRAGVCLSTLGPGATNLITGLADAQLDTAAVVAITAQGGLDRLHNQSHQMLDIVSMFKPITKWNTSIYSPEIVTGVVRKAFKLAQAEKPGVTHLELPEDIAGAEVRRALEPLAPNEVMRADPDRRAIGRAVRLLEQAERPLIIAGNGAIRDRASRRLTQLAEQWGIPVVATFMGKGAISDHRDESLLTIGLGFKDFVLEAVEASDLVLTVGYDIAEYAPQAWNPEHRKRIVHIDSVPAEIYTHYVPEVEVIGDISAALDDCLAGLKQRDEGFDRDWYRPVRQRILDDIASYTLRDGESFTIPGVLNVIRDILDDDGLLISDVGSHKMWIARNFPTYCPNGCIITNGLASMGMALPGGIAASLLERQRQVVAVMGDGGFLMNSQELETAVRLGVGFTIVIVNDNDYGLIKWKQEMAHGKSFGTELGNPDFKAYAESFGIKAYHSHSLRELKEHMRIAIQSSDLNVVVATVDPRVNNELVNKLSDYFSAKSD